MDYGLCGGSAMIWKDIPVLILFFPFIVIMVFAVEQEKKRRRKEGEE